MFTCLYTKKKNSKFKINQLNLTRKFKKLCSWDMMENPFTRSSSKKNYKIVRVKILKYSKMRIKKKAPRFLLTRSFWPKNKWKKCHKSNFLIHSVCITKTSQTWPRLNKKIENFKYKNHQSAWRSNCENISYSIRNGKIGDRSNNYNWIEKYNFYGFVN